MGKDRTKDRKKVQSSSSSSASSLLSGTGFIGFSDVMGGGAGGGGGAALASSFSSAGGNAKTSSSSATPFYTGEDADLKVVCKRLTKKDGVTKHKALLELAQLVQERGSVQPSSSSSSSPSSLVEGLIPFWLYIYPRLVLLEDDRRVREAVFSIVLPQLFAFDRKTMVGVLGRHLLAPWWYSMSDTQREVAQAATRAFETVFPKKAKREELVAQAAPVLLSYLQENFCLQAGDAALDTSGGGGGGGGNQLAQEEAEERLERITITSLTALSSLLHTLDEPIRLRLLNDASMKAATTTPTKSPPSAECPPSSSSSSSSASLPFLLIDGQCASLEDILSPSTVITPGSTNNTNTTTTTNTTTNIWKFLTDPRPLVRRAAYNLLAAVASKADHVIRHTGLVSKLSNLVCGLLAEKKTSNFGSMWEALLLFFHHFPKALTTGNLDIHTQLFPRVLKLIRGSFHAGAAAQVSCPSLLPLVALIPPAVAGSFYVDVLEALWKGAKGDKSHEGEEPYLVAVSEIVTYLLVRQEQPPPPQQQGGEGEAPAGPEGPTHTDTHTQAEMGHVLVEQLLMVVIKVLTHEGGDGNEKSSKALITALVQLQKAGGETNRTTRKCLLLDVDQELWQGLQAVALRLLALPDPLSFQQELAVGHEKVLTLAAEEGGGGGGDGVNGRALEGRANRLSFLLTSAYEKVTASTEGGLEASLSLLFWQCIHHCETHTEKTAGWDVQAQQLPFLVPYLVLIEAVALCVPFARLSLFISSSSLSSSTPSSSSSINSTTASTFLLSFLIPFLQQMVASSAPAAVLKPLVSAITALNLGLLLSPSSPYPSTTWKELLNAVTPPADTHTHTHTDTTLSTLLIALEAISVTYERVCAGLCVSKSSSSPHTPLPPLNSLISDAVLPYASAIIEGATLPETKDEHVRFLAVCLGASKENTTHTHTHTHTHTSTRSSSRKRPRHQPPLLAPTTVTHLVEHTLTCQDEVGLEALVLALDKGDKECVVLDAVREKTSEILTMAFQKLGPAGDVRIASVLSVWEEEGEESESEGEGEEMVVVAAAAAPSFRRGVVGWLRSFLVVEGEGGGRKEEEEGRVQEWIDAFVRLVEILSSASHEAPSHFIPTLLFESGLAVSSTWTHTRTHIHQQEKYHLLWRCLEGVMHELVDESLLHGPSEIASVLLRPDADQEESVALIYEVLRAGVELGDGGGEGGLAAAPAAAAGRFVGCGGAFTFSRFLSAAVASNGKKDGRLPSDCPFQLFFPFVGEEEGGGGGGGESAVLPLEMIRLLAQVVARYLPALGSSSSSSNDDDGSLWHDAYLLARLVSLLEPALLKQQQQQQQQSDDPQTHTHTHIHTRFPRRLINEAAWDRVVLPKELTTCFDSPDELRFKTEVWYFDKRAADASATHTHTQVWKKGTVVGIHRDDEEKYFTISKAQGGGETQMEFKRLRRAKPAEIGGLVAGVCEGLEDLRYVDGVGVVQQQQQQQHVTGSSEGKGLVEEILRALMQAVGAVLETGSSLGLVNVAVAWTVGEVLRGLRRLISSPFTPLDVQHQVEDWLDARRASVVAALLHAPPNHASLLYILAALPALDMDKASELWQVALQGGWLTGKTKKKTTGGGEAVNVSANIAEHARVATLCWAQGLSATCRGQAACLKVLEEVWVDECKDNQPLSQAAGLHLASIDLGLQTVLEKGGIALASSTKVALFRLALKGMTSTTHAQTQTQTQLLTHTYAQALTAEMANRCRLLAVGLVPNDNKNLEWTMQIYALDPTAARPSLNLPVWNQDIDALLAVLESSSSSAASSPSCCLHMSAFHVLRPYLRSATDVDEEEDEEEEATKKAAAAGSGKNKDDVLSLAKGERAKALASAKTEKQDLLRDLHIVEKRLPPRLHSMLHAWMSPPSSTPHTRTHTHTHTYRPEATQCLVHLLEWEGLLEAVGGDGEEGVRPEELIAYRRGLFQALLAWLLFLEHVEGVALSTPLRDAYSTYLSLLGALPVLLEACFRVLSRRLGGLLVAEPGISSSSSGGGGDNNNTYDSSNNNNNNISTSSSSTTTTTTGDKPTPFELQDLWNTVHILSSSPSSTTTTTTTTFSPSPSHSRHELRRLVSYTLFRTIVAFPALVRKWWTSSDCERWLSASISKFVEEQASGRIMQREIDLLNAKTGQGKDAWGGGEDEILVRGSAVTREVIAVYFKDDCTLEVMLRLPLAYPLRNVEVECTRSLGVSADKWNRWRLQIVTLLSMRDGSVVDAVGLWVRNLQKEFEGMEPCPICMSTIEARNLTLPERECRTCHNKFHSSCILKWFATSGRNKCVICQQSTIG